jgi:tetratricopeptide (TPR) repeat protein
LNKTKKYKKIKEIKSPVWFYLFMLLLPVFFFLALEIFLRFIDYGRNNEQWIKITDSKLMLNPDIAGRYFPNTQNFPQSNNDAFDIEKRKNAFRIFVLGGSSAQGFPFSPNGTFSRYIRDRLELLYPDSYIEVINLGITATNSYTIRDLIPGVLAQKPDLILIYAGHNEYYGAFGVGSTENIGNSRRFVDFRIWLNRFKTVELVQNLINSFLGLFGSESKPNPHRGGTLMAQIVKDQMISFNSESFNVGINQFRENFEDVLQLTKKAEIPVVIGTLVCNLKDQKPFISVGEYPDQRADSVFNRAYGYLNYGNFRKSDSLFRKAKDLDALRFRAPEKINEIIRSLTSKYNCKIVDVDSVFNSVSSDGIVGKNLIVDHLHPLLKGYQLMGKIYFETIEKNNLLPNKEKLRISDTRQDSLVISNFAFSRLDSVVSQIRLAGLLNDWPFVENTDFSFIKKFKLHDKIDSIAYRIALDNMNWEKGHREAAQWYLSNDDYGNFAVEFKVIISQYPFKLVDYDFAISQLINQKLFDLALYFLNKRYKENADAFSAKWLGSINLNKGNFDEAIEYLAESIKYDDSDAQAYYNLAGAYIQKQDYKNALQEIDNCLEINPDFPNAKKIKLQLLKQIPK